MKENISYKSTILACYIGNFTQAIVVNLTPILFIPLREIFQLSYSQFGLLVLINFITQVGVDIAFSKAVDTHGFRPFVVAAHVLCVIGFVFFAITPMVLPGKEFYGFLVGTIIFAGAGGLLELLLSPIVDAIPGEEKEKAMALLHSFYAWGQVTVVIITTISLFMGVEWYYIMMGWSIVPLVNIVFFAKVPLKQKHVEGGAMKIGELIKTPIFLIAFGAITFGGAAEVTMSQWASSFMEKGLALPKVTGDLLGMCGFAIFMGIGRVIYGVLGSRMNLQKILIRGSLLAFISYIIVAISPFTWLSILGCAITGLCVSLVWPGTLVIASERMPLAGASMFALLAAGGDIGASLGPWITGVITDTSIKLGGTTTFLTTEQFGLRIGIFIAALLPLMSFVFQRKLKKLKEKH